MQEHSLVFRRGTGRGQPLDLIRYHHCHVSATRSGSAQSHRPPTAPSEPLIPPLEDTIHLEKHDPVVPLTTQDTTPEEHQPPPQSPSYSISLSAEPFSKASDLVHSSTAPETTGGHLARWCAAPNGDLATPVMPIFLSPVRYAFNKSVAYALNAGRRRDTPHVVSADRQDDDGTRKERQGFKPQYAVPLKAPRNDLEAQKLYNHM